MDQLTVLVATEEIKALKARYFRCLDEKDWSGFREVFADDCVFDFSAAFSVASARGRSGQRGDDTHSDGGPVSTSADDFVDGLKVSLDGALTIHHGLMPEIEIVSPHSARGVWAMSDVIRRPAGSTKPSIAGHGHYHEEYVHERGAWRISSVRLSRLTVTHIDPLP